MKKLVIVVLVLVLLSSLVSAQVPTAELSATQQLAQDLFDRTDIESSEDVLFVRGSHQSAFERVTFGRFIETYDFLRVIDIVDDNDFSMDLLDDKKTLAFLGGPAHNVAAREFIESQHLRGERQSYGPLVVMYASSSTHSVIFFSDARGFDNFDRAGLVASPLKGFVPDAFIPPAAAGISIILLILLDLLNVAFENVLQERASKGRRFKKKFIGFFLGKTAIKLRECIALLIGSVFFAAALTWNFVGTSSSFWLVLLINVGVAFTVLFLQEVMRIFYARRVGVSTEYVLYWPGVLTTLASSYFGTVFGVPGVVAYDEKADQKKLGKIWYVSTLFIFFLGIVLFVVNFFAPSPLVQMAMTIASTVAFFEFLPIGPINGRDMFAWNKKIWGITFVLLLILYVLINFVL